MTTVVAGYDLVIFDLDGVIYLGEQPIAGAGVVIRRLAAEGVHRSYATNNASRRAPEVVDLLQRLDVPAQPADVTTSAQVAAAHLAAEFAPATPILVVGAEALRAEVADAGLEPVQDADSGPAAVVQGYAKEVGWEQLAEASVAIRAGARWVATNADKTLPSPRGPLPGNGSLLAVLRTALDREPDLVVGKPAPQLFLAARERIGATKPLVVGDRLDTDIEGANRAGFDSLAVLTGVMGARALLDAEPHQRPTMVAGDAGALFGDPSDVLIPVGGNGTGGWTAALHGGAIELTGSGSASAALATLCAVSWGSRVELPIAAGSAAAVKALRDLQLAD